MNDQIQAYLLEGIPSGWTSGLASGYVPVGPPGMISGITTIQALPYNPVTNSQQITVFYQPGQESTKITIWNTPLTPIVSGDSEQIRYWLFRR